MFEIPTLIIPSLVAFILLGLFLAFWVAVVVCLATANSPAFQKLTTPVSNEELPALPSSTQSPPHNNVGADYKPLNLVEYRDVDLLRNMVWIYLIGLIWTGEFICGKFNVYHINIFVLKKLLTIIVLIKIHKKMYSLRADNLGWSSCFLVF